MSNSQSAEREIEYCREKLDEEVSLAYDCLVSACGRIEELKRLGDAEILEGQQGYALDALRQAAFLVAGAWKMLGQ